jgi:hypothetical protein
MHHVYLYNTFTLVGTPQIERYRGNSMILIEYVQMACLGHFWNFSGNARFQGGFSYISEFKTKLKIIYEALIVLSSITKKGEIESASRPPSGFWCLNDKTIKELMTFAKCETWKMSYKLHWDHSLFKTYVMAMMITYLCMPYDKKKSANEKEEIELIIYVSCQLAP